MRTEIYRLSDVRMVEVFFFFFALFKHCKPVNINVLHCAWPPKHVCHVPGKSEINNSDLSQHTRCSVKIFDIET